MTTRIVTLAGIVLLQTAAGLGAETKPAPGLTSTFTSLATRASDVADSPSVALYVQAGQPPTPFLPGGPFTTVWEGSILAELRGNWSFQATLNGKLTVEINGATVLEATGAGTASPLSKAVQLNKGANAFKATFNSPSSGDAFVRLWWTEKPPFTSPIPASSLNHAVSPELERANEVRSGRELFLEHRCIQCHSDPVKATGVPELRMDAPGLDGLGPRRRSDWLARWILDPKSLRPSARMPKLFTGPDAKEKAEAIAAFLQTLPAADEPKSTAVAYRTKQNEPKEGEGAPPAGDPKPLYERLHCLGCHNPPDAVTPDPGKLSQKRIAEKFPPGRLAEYLRAPEARYAWTRMPNFHLSEAEAKELETWLFAAAPKPAPAPASSSPEPGLVEKGRKLVQSSGCLNCHVLKLENEAKAAALAQLAPERWTAGCLAPDGATGGKAPDFGFTPAERAALQALGRSDRASLARSVPAEFAERQTRLLNCGGCHGQLEGFPPLELLGGKLKPEWSSRFLAGKIPHKVRYDAHPKGEVWLEARMPAFASRAADLAAGLAAQHGYGPITPTEPPADAALAEIGRKLVGKDGGFSCVSCHGVGPMLALEVFESEGPNLTEAADRLQPDYYRRWFRAPSSIDPQTKMPVYFDDGKSPLTEILDGDQEKQISAVWEYLKLREKMQAPNTGAQ